MSRKKSIPDSVGAGRSRVVPYHRGEDFRIRHARRLRSNLEQEGDVRRWCEKRGLTLGITNEGHLWQITDGGFLAEWWPSFANHEFCARWPLFGQETSVRDLPMMPFIGYPERQSPHLTPPAYVALLFQI